MKRLMNILATFCGAAIAFCSCTDELINGSVEHPVGVDYGTMVEVTIPFSIAEEMSATIVTRAGEEAGHENELKGIQLAVYEANGGAAGEDKLILWKRYEKKNSGSDTGDGFWEDNTGTDTADDGFLRFHAPTGRVYIYILGNATGTLMNYYPNAGGNPEALDLSTRQAFIDNVQPQWTGSFTSDDGYLPMTAMVNNRTGACFIEEGKTAGRGNIYYYKDEEAENRNEKTYIDPTDGIDNTFALRRLVAKINFNITAAEGRTFTPSKYIFRHVGQNVPANLRAGYDYGMESDYLERIPVMDSPEGYFTPTTPNSFTVYLPENRRNLQEGKKVDSYNARDAIEKTADSKNVMEDDGIHYKFANAPQNSTYVEIYGRYEGPGKDTGNGTATVTADTRYIIHLGDFGADKEEGYEDFNVERNCEYTYNVTVKGVDNIITEVVDKQENQPGVEGIVFRGGEQVRLDAHYEAVEMRLTKEQIKRGVYLYAKTPFGETGYMYGGDDPGTEAEREAMGKNMQWVKFMKQTTPHELARYKENEAVNAYEILKQIAENSSASDKDYQYITCFIDEYFYTSDPTDNGTVELTEFINADDRIFTMGSNVSYSSDGKSIVSDAVYVLQQRSIACFYDVDNFEGNMYGIETADETGNLPYANGNALDNPDRDVKKGLENTRKDLETMNAGFGAVNWVKNGYLLNDEGKLEKAPMKERLNTQYAYAACLSRNRDFDGDDSIDEGELRWYTPARDQLLGMWIGQPGLLGEQYMFQGKIEEEWTSGNVEAPIFTSNGGQSRIIWSEQGCSFGSADSPNGGTIEGTIRAVRNLGKKEVISAAVDDVPSAYYSYDSGKREITVHLKPEAMRSVAIVGRELLPHDETSPYNRVYRKYKVAEHAYVGGSKSDECPGGLHISTGRASPSYMPLQTTSANDAKRGLGTIAQDYAEEEGETDKGAWRLPNQRELALAIVAIPDFFNGMLGDTYATVQYEHSIIGSHWRRQTNHILHCRTAFSNNRAFSGGKYTQWGYCIYLKNDGYMGLMDEGDEDIGSAGTAGYLCVRDVPE